MQSIVKAPWVLIVSFFLLSSCIQTNEVIVDTAYSERVSLNGKVISQETEQPIPYVRVWLKGTSFNAKTDANGEFSLQVPKGYYQLLTWKEGYYEHNKTINVGKYTDWEKSLDLEPIELYRNESSSFTDAMNMSTDKLLASRLSNLRNQIDSLENEIAKVEAIIANGYDVKQQDLQDIDPFDRASSMPNDMVEYENGADEKIQNFIKYYINDGLKCKLTNPYELKFQETSQKGLLRLDEVAYLNVINEALGYEIDIKLDGFYAQENENVVIVQEEADYFFTELKPENNRQAKKWEENRRKYFEGSFRHFLISMATNKPPVLFGYKFYSGNFVENVTGLGYSNTTVGDNEILKRDFYRKNRNNDSNTFDYDGQIRVEYTRNGNTDPDNIMGLGDFLNQTSWISFKDEELVFSNNGTVMNPDAIDISGYWSYVPVCKMLPDDYLPNYTKKDNS